MANATEFGKSGAVSALRKTLKQSGVKFISIRTVSVSGIVYAKNIALNLLDDDDSFLKGVAFGTCCFALPIMLDTIPTESGITATHDLRLVGDLGTLGLPPFNKTRAVMFGNLFNPNGSPSDLCPRFLLQRQIKECSEKQNSLKVMVGAEIEFTLTKKHAENGNSLTINNSHFCVSSDLDDNRYFIDDAYDWLDGQDVLVEAIHGEAGDGQYEIVLKYTDPVSLADKIIIVKETLRQVARKYNYEISFLPQPLSNGSDEPCGFNNGLHLHLSIANEEGKNVFYNHEYASSNDNRNSFPPTVSAISSIGQSFLAGILDHIHALSALTTPSTNSFRRLMHQGGYVGNFGAWGYDNRQVPLRVCSAMSNNIPLHFEMKMHDSTSNPYLALCGLIAAGFDGVTKQMSLPEQITGDPSSMSEEELSRLGIKMLPKNPLVALDILENDSVLTNAMGETMTKCYIAVRRHEANHFMKLSVKEEIHQMRQRGY